jgi:hypothetical protein
MACSNRSLPATADCSGFNCAAESPLNLRRIVRFSLRQLPNLISVLRILLIVPIALALALAHDELLLTLALLVVASVVAHGQFALPPDWALTLLGALVLVTVVISGLDYGLVLYGLVFAQRAAAAAR